MPEGKHSIRDWTKQLRGSSSLSGDASGSPISHSIIRLMDRLLGRTEDSTNPGESPYDTVKQNYNRIQQGRDAYKAEEEAATPVSQMTTLRGALTAYWTGEKWKQAYLQTGAIAVLGVVSAANTVWIVQASAAMTDTIAKLCLDPENAALMPQVLQNVGQVGLTGATAIATFWGIERLKMDMGRHMAHWITDKFKDAALQKPDTLLRFTHNKDKDSAEPDRIPDNPHQRLSDSVRDVSRLSLEIGSWTWSSVLTCAVVTKTLWDKSVPITFLDELAKMAHAPMLAPGNAGMFVLSATVLTAYLGATFSLGANIGSHLEKTNTNLQKSLGEYTKMLVNTFDRAEAIADSGGHKEYSQKFSKIYGEYDQRWHAENVAYSRYLGFTFLQGFVGQNIVAALPAVAGALSRNLTFQGFMETTGLTSSFLGSSRFLFEVVPMWQRLKASTERVVGMAQMFERVADKKSFYELSGRHDFQYGTPTPVNNIPILRIHDLELSHRAQTMPLLKIEDVVINKGDRVYVEGRSGSGKSCLFQALNGRFPYGGGMIEMEEGTKIFLARQEPDIDPDLALSSLVAYGSKDSQSPDPVRVEQALERAGLGHFIPEADSLTREGRPWQGVLSGGQKQRLVLARMLYQQPDLALLDEATANLHPAARSEFLSTLQTYCPGITIIAIMHNEHPDGDFTFNKKLKFDEGRDGSAFYAELQVMDKIKPEVRPDMIVDPAILPLISGKDAPSARPMA